MAPMKPPTPPTTTTTTEVKPRAARSLPTLLVLDPAASLSARINDLATALQYRVIAATTLRDARTYIAQTRVDLLITDTKLPDHADPLTLLPLLRKKNPASTALVTADHPTPDDLIAAMHAGAADFLPKTANKSQLAAHLKRALDRTTAAARVDRRIDRLTAAVRRLSEARRTVSQKVDLLCNDLVSAYGQLTKQMDQVRLQEDFRKCVTDAKDLEQLLCHAMDWVMRHLGYANFAVFLAAGEDESTGATQFELGAYVKYTLPSTPEMIAALKAGLLPATARHGTIHLPGPEAAKQLTPAERTHLAKQTVLTATCAYLGESLAMLVLFRDESAPFTPDDVATLQSIAPLFANALSAATHTSGTDDDPAATDDNTTAPDGDDADWWKHGGEAPF